MKLKLILLVCSVIFTDTVYSQYKSKWSLGLYFSPDICYRTLKNHDGSAGTSELIKLRDEFEVPTFGYSTGLIIKRLLGEKFSLESGIGFTNKGFETISFPYTTVEDPDGINTSVFYSFHYRYLTIPIKGIYSMKLSKRWKFQVGLGIENNIYLDNYNLTYINYNDTFIKRNRGSDPAFYKYNTYHLMATCNLGFEYSISNTVSVRAEPTFRQALSSYLNDSTYGYFWNAGFSMGCLFKL